MKHHITLAVLSVIAFGATGCTSGRMTDQQRAQYAAQQDAGVVVDRKSAGLAVGLGFVPFAIGAAYTNNSVLQGTTQFLFWPASIVWGPLGNWTKVRKLNYEATVLSLTEERRNKLAALDSKQPDYAAKRKEIDDYYRPLMPIDQ